MVPYRPPAPPVQAKSGHVQVDAAAERRGWQAIDRAGEIVFRKGQRDVIVTRRVLDTEVFRDRIVRQLEQG
jgi:hypothetical protein